MAEIDMQKAKADLWKEYSKVGPQTAKAMNRMKNRTNKYTGIIEGKDMRTFKVTHKNKTYITKATDAENAVKKVRDGYVPEVTKTAQYLWTWEDDLRIASAMLDTYDKNALRELDNYYRNLKSAVNSIVENGYRKQKSALEKELR